MLALGFVSLYLALIFVNNPQRPSSSLECVELLDSNFIRATNLYGQSSRKWAEKDTLYFKFQGPSPASIAETARIVKEITEKSKYGGTGWTLAKDEQEATDLWMDRKNAHYSGLALEPGARGLSTDVWLVFILLPQRAHLTINVKRACIKTPRPCSSDQGGPRFFRAQVHDGRPCGRWKLPLDALNEER